MSNTTNTPKHKAPANMAAIMRDITLTGAATGKHVKVGA